MKFVHPTIPNRVDPMLIVWPVCVERSENAPLVVLAEKETNPPTGPSTEIPFEATANSFTFILPTEEGDELYRFELRR